MATLFVSDVHLSTQRPEIVACFERFLQTTAREAESLYILGDLFDEWLGDDDHKPPHPRIMKALATLAASGVPVHVLRGNHDFLLGNAFESQSGCRLLDEPAVVDLYGARVLLLHGDILCTRDTEYQAFRKTSRDPKAQREFLSLPMDVRVGKVAALRGRSREAVRLMPEEIMDVSPEAVIDAMGEHRVTFLVHGHTHRPAVHSLDVAGRAAVRIVLGDWYEQDSVLVWSKDGYRLGRIRDLQG